MSLVEDYERILSLEEAATWTDELETTQSAPVSIPLAHAHRRLADLASKKLSALDESRLKIWLGSKNVVLKDGVDQVVTIVGAAKDIVSSTLASDPHAALAWAGVCVLLPLLLNPKKQYDDATAGLLEVPLIIRRYEVLENIYRVDDLGSYENRNRLKGGFEEKVTNLYCKILQYQARAVCPWSRNSFHQYGHDNTDVMFSKQTDGRSYSKTLPVLTLLARSLPKLWMLTCSKTLWQNKTYGCRACCRVGPTSKIRLSEICATHFRSPWIRKSFGDRRIEASGASRRESLPLSIWAIELPGPQESHSTTSSRDM